MSSTLTPEDARVICENLTDLSAVSLNTEIEEDELALRYGGESPAQEESDSGIQIFRPEDSEIVARYAVKKEPEPHDDEIILNHPDDDDVVKRYSSYFLPSNMEGSSAECREDAAPVVNDEDTCNATVGTDDAVGPSPTVSEPIPPNDVELSDLDPPLLENDVEEAANPTSESGSDLSDFDRIHPISPSRLSLEEESESLDELDDGALADPASPHNRSITFYNLCCNKEIFSSISIDSPMREALRGLHHCRSTMRSGNLDIFPRSGERERISRKPRNRSRSKVISRNDNLVCVIHKLERIAQAMETRCIEARRSLRKSCSQANFARTGAKLNSDLTPLLSSSFSLLRKVRTNVP